MSHSGTIVEHPGDSCSNCGVYRQSTREKTISLQEDFEQDGLRRVMNNHEMKRVMVSQPFVKD